VSEPTVSDRHLRAAHALADVPWLRRSRRAYAAWYLRVAALVVGCGVVALTLEAGLATGATLLGATLGLILATVGLVAGATYGRIVGGLAAALAVGYAPHWLAARIGACEGHPRRLAAELESFAGRQPA
jgi:hypothetical protein